MARAARPEGTLHLLQGNSGDVPSNEHRTFLVVLRLNVDDAAQGLNIRENEIRAGDGTVEGYLAAVDPSDGQSSRFAADEVRELRLPGVQDIVLRDARILDQVAKQRAVRLIAPGPLRGAYQVEVPLLNAHGNGPTSAHQN